MAGCPLLRTFFFGPFLAPPCITVKKLTPTLEHTCVLGNTPFGKQPTQSEGVCIYGWLQAYTHSLQSSIVQTSRKCDRVSVCQKLSKH